MLCCSELNLHSFFSIHCRSVPRDCWLFLSLLSLKVMLTVVFWGRDVYILYKDYLNTIIAAILSVLILSHWLCPSGYYVLNSYLTIFLFCFLCRWNGSPSVGGRDNVRGGGEFSSPPCACAWIDPRVWWGWRSCSAADPGWGCRWNREWGCNSTSGGKRNMDQTDGLHHVLRGFC